MNIAGALATENGREGQLVMVELRSEDLDQDLDHAV